jgi:acyl dehydratase
MQFGRCFEEFEIGDIYKHWPGRTITEYDDTLFSMLTMNHNPLHIDAHYCEGTQFKQRLVVGPLIFSIALGMSVPDVSGKAIANLEFENVKHLAPTFHGDTIYAETRVLDKRLSSTKPDRGIVTVETIAYNQRGENVLSFKRRVMVPTKEYDGAWQRAWDENMVRLRKRHEGGTEL